MKNSSTLPTDIYKGKPYTARFQVSADMVKKFMDLTGDRSSLHRDEAFGRRSMYRGNIVHGMLPLIFISSLRLCGNKSYSFSFIKISGRFYRPVFVNEGLLLSAKILGIDREQREVEFDYALKRLDRDAILTGGTFTLQFADVLQTEVKTSQDDAKYSKKCITLNSLTERDLQFEQIVKGDKKDFVFSLFRIHHHMLYEILTDGFLPGYKLDCNRWSATCNTANLLSTCLYSTFVGMCIPGRHATFIDFDIKFHKDIEWNKEYLFEGEVGFKSKSTSSLIEHVSISDARDRTSLYAKGKINATVNEPPIKMPSVKFLKKKAMDLELKDKVVLVTGSSRGIGETTAKLFSLYGSKVAVNYFRSKKDALKIVDEINRHGGRAIALEADITDMQQVREMVSTIRKKYGTVNILVNNAVRGTYPASFMELAWEDFQKDIDVTIKGAINCCQAVLPLMLKNKKGKIVNISTVFTDNPPPNQTKYVLSKGGLVGLTRSLAIEFAPYNIQVNMVVPSIVETDLSKHVSRMFLEAMKNDTPMRRNATPVDVAKAVIFLASSLASFTTGQKIMVTGGNAPFL